MKEEIINNIENPAELERLYHLNSMEFSKCFAEAYILLKDLPAAEFWFARINFDSAAEKVIVPYKTTVSPGDTSNKKFGLIFTIAASLIAGTLIKIPEILNIPDTNYIANNTAFFLFPLLIVYYLIKNKPGIKTVIIIAGIILISITFANLLPGNSKSDTRILSDIHLTLFMWILLGITYVGFDFKSNDKVLYYLKRNGDVIILSSVILFAGIQLTTLSVGLFRVIKVPIEHFYYSYVVVYGLISAPIVANYIIESSPGLINKVAPVISKIFAPLILITMTGFIFALVFFAKDPFNDRDELLVFNILLVAIIAVIVFSFSGQTAEIKSYYNKFILILSLEAIIINSVAISAIIYRLFALGVSPNRIYVLGGNILMFINLIIITYKLFMYIKNKSDKKSLNHSMTIMMPYYAVWTLIVSFIFPFIFWFK